MNENEIYPSHLETVQENKHKAQLKGFWSLVDRGENLQCGRLSKVLFQYLWNLFHHNGGGGFISGRGYRANTEPGKGQSAHMDMCEVGW